MDEDDGDQSNVENIKISEKSLATCKDINYLFLKKLRIEQQEIPANVYGGLKFKNRSDDEDMLE